MDPDPGLTIIILGHTGVGKSASGNTILGRTAFVTKRSFRSVTTEISEQSGTVFGKQISVVDTPGILGSEREIWTWCQENPQSSRPRLFLLVIKIDRFTIEHKNAVDAALRVIGDDKLNCYLLFTGGDDLNDMTLDDFISEDPEAPLICIAEEFERRLHVFNNDSGGPEQVRELLEKSGHLSQVARPRTERRMVLLGLPGGGKSSSGNTILGSPVFITGCDFNSVSTEPMSKSAEVAGHWVTVVDTPGLHEDMLSSQLYDEIMRSVTKAEPGPHAFIIVVRMGRMSRADSAQLQMLLELFDSDAKKYTMLVFTHGDELGGQSIEVNIQSCSCVSDLVSMCGGRFCVFNNKERKDRVQVQKFMNKIDELVTANEGEAYTSEMFTAAFNRSKRTRQAETTQAPRETAPLAPPWWRECFPACCCSSSGSDDEREPLLSRHQTEIN